MFGGGKFDPADYGLCNWTPLSPSVANSIPWVAVEGFDSEVRVRASEADDSDKWGYALGPNWLKSLQSSKHCDQTSLDISRAQRWKENFKIEYETTVVASAAASSDDKLALCTELGADHVINYSNESLKDRVKELTGGAGVDVVYDPVGGDFSEPAVRSMGWKGRYLVIGFASGPIPSIPLNLTLLKGCSIVGVFWGRFTMEEPEVHLANIDTLWQWFEEGKIKPVITDLFPIEEYEGAYAAMMERRAKGKVILTF